MEPVSFFFINSFTDLMDSIMKCSVTTNLFSDFKVVTVRHEPSGSGTRNTGL